MGKTFLCERAEEPDWWSQTGSNRRPPACKAGALPAELWPRTSVQQKLVGLGRFELPTSRLSSARSNQLSYKPKIQRPGGRLLIPATANAIARDEGRHGLVHE